jgi:hypothetical protein
MSEPVQLALIAAAASVIPSIFSYLTHRRMDELEKNTNHLKDELVAAAKAGAFAAGVKSQKEKETGG